MSSNPFMLAGALAMVGACAWSAWEGDWRSAAVYLCFAAANALLGAAR